MIKRMFASIITVVGAVWTTLNGFAATITLWPDLSAFWRENMSGDPWMPWALLAIGISCFAWIYWPAYRSLFASGRPTEIEKARLDQSVNIGTMTGGTVAPVFNNSQTIVSPSRQELSDVEVEMWVDKLRGRNIHVDIIGDAKCQAIGQRLLDRLSTSGIVIENVRIIGMMSPAPEVPYSVFDPGDGNAATFVVSPSSLP